MVFEFTVLSKPIAKGRPRFARTPKGVRTYTPAKTKLGEKQIRDAFVAKYPDAVPMQVQAVAIRMTAFVQIPKSVAKKWRGTALPTTRPDLDQYLKTCLDALTGLAFVDDSQVVDITAHKRFSLTYDGDEWVPYAPYWMITVEGLHLG